MKTEEGVNLSIFGGLTFGRIGEPEVSNDGILLLASKYDLLMTKLKIIMGRALLKDYIDIAVMLDNGLKLDIGLGGNISIYKDEFSSFFCLRALTFFNESDLYQLDDKYRKILIKYADEVDLKRIKSVPIISKSLFLDIV